MRSLHRLDGKGSVRTPTSVESVKMELLKSNNNNKKTHEDKDTHFNQRVTL